jgi:hypothetical protein
MSTKSKLVLVLVVTSLAYVFKAGGSDPIDVEVAE